MRTPCNSYICLVSSTPWSDPYHATKRIPTQEIFLYLYAKIPSKEPRKAKYRQEVSKSIRVTKKKKRICKLISYSVFTEDIDSILASLTSNGEIHPTSHTKGTSKGHSSATLQESRAAAPRHLPTAQHFLSVPPHFNGSVPDIRKVNFHV